MSILKFDNHTLDLPSLKHSYEEDGFLLIRDFASPTETDLLERYAIAARKVRLDELEKQQNKQPEFAALAVKGLQQNCEWLAKQMHEGPHLGLLEFLLGDSVWPVSAALVDRPSGSEEGIYPHIDAADYAELVKTNKGENRNLDLVFKTEDSKGEIYTVRPPFQPKEIAKFQTIISKENLTVTFTADHEFLFILNSRNKVIGGLYYKLKNNLRIHLEWVVIMKKYQNRNLSKRLMDDFFNRMSQAGHKIVTVGFYHESFFYKQGFEIDQSFGGLVKNLK